MQTSFRKSEIDITDELRRGCAYHQAAQYAKAREIYSKILKVEPFHPDALNLKGLLALEEGDLDRAEDLIASAIQQDSKQPFFYNNIGNVYLQKGCLDKAAQNYRKAVALKPDYADAHFNLGNVNQQLGNSREAIVNYCRTLQIDPESAPACFNLGKALRSENQNDQALKAFHDAIRLKPRYVEAYDEIANIYDELSQPDQAIYYYEKSLELKPKSWSACFNLANLYRLQNDMARAIRYYQNSLELNPHLDKSYLNLGIAHKAAGNRKEAERCYRRCIEMSPGLAEAYYNLGNLYNEMDRFSEAVRYYRQALAIRPEMAAVWNNLGDVYRQQGEFGAAADSYHQSLAIQPDRSETLLNLGNALIKLNRSEEAIGLFKQIKEIDPEFNLAYSSMGSAYLALDRFDEAEVFYRTALEKDPMNSMVLFNLGVACQAQGNFAQSKNYLHQALKLDSELSAARWRYHLLLPVLYDSEEEIIYYRNRFEKGLDYLIKTTELRSPQETKAALEGIRSRTNFYLSYQGKNDLTLQKKYGNFAAQIMGAAYPQWAGTRKMPSLSPGSKIRVGFATANMYFHTVGSYLRGWIENINHQEFELFGYHIGNKTDALTETLQRMFDHYFQVSDNVELAAQQIVAADLHVLVFPDIGMNSQSILLAAMRLAPIQCTSWGHPVTSGLPTMDYFLSSDLMEPENASSHYSEKLIRLPNIALCYQKPAAPEYHAERKSFGIDEKAFVYLSPQSLFKYLPQYDDIFPLIALQIPAAKFIFISHPSNYLTGKFKERLTIAFDKHQIDMQSYCLFLPRLNFEEYLSLNLVSNVLLDTPEWSGGKTSIEGISCGLPVVTTPGELMRSRHTYAMLKRMDIEETVADDIEDYIAIAVRLEKDKHFYSDMKQKIKSSGYRLFDDYSVPKALSRFLKAAVKEFCEND